MKDIESKIVEDDGSKDYRARVKDSLLERDYNFFNYLIYILYIPLYLAGPIITFNDFIYQVFKIFLILFINILKYKYI